MSHFQAQELKKLGENQYNAILAIDSVTKNDAASSIQLIVETDPKNPSHKWVKGKQYKLGNHAEIALSLLLKEFPFYKS